MNLFNIRRPAPSLDDLILDPPAPALRDDLSDACLMPTPARPPQVFVRGQGSWLWDSDDRAFLDFVQAGAANSLGHSPQILAKALANQSLTLINPGNGLHNRAQLNLADRLCQHTGSDQAYLLNSGAQACEAAIRLARKWGQLHRGGAHHIITARNGCHGHSFAAMAASAIECANRFEPQLPGFSHVPFNDLPALHAAVDAKTVAIMLEPVQGGGGCYPGHRTLSQGRRALVSRIGHFADSG
ncbi:MAG: Succinylornithine transaminase/acetylornithine aminotransferase [Pseudomonas fluorescens]|nr:MAG: Succinylornithine transaminase/acetylornithine aminotransferase [Pseudomonas fluorescens]